MKTKRTLALALTVVMLCTALVTAVGAADTEGFLMAAFTYTTEEAEEAKLVSVTGIALQFEGEQEEILAEDLTELALTVDGEAVDFALAEKIEFTTEPTAEEEETLPETHFFLSFEEEFTQAGLFAFTGLYKDMPFTAGILVNEDRTFDAALEDDGEEDQTEAPGEDEVATEPEDLTATPTAATVYVNEAEVSFDAYNIGGNNYFKLRDLAYVLNGTEKQFEVEWDEANNAILLVAGQAYTEVGGEMAAKGEDAMTALPTTSAILLGGEAVELTAYNIGGNNYFKLRDLGALFDFGVNWDGENNAISIVTAEGYTPEA